jgi:hypothetical protein
MKLYELQSLVDGVQCKAAVYDEIASFLTRAIDEGLDIPVDVGDGSVPVDYVEAVLKDICATRDALIQKLELVDDVEVRGVTAKDFSLD